VGLLQPHARHRGGDGAAGLRRAAVVIHALADAEAALAAAAAEGSALALWSAVGAAAYLGPLYWQELERALAASHPESDFLAVLDCAERPGDALAALRQGLQHLCFTGGAEAAGKLDDIARAAGATLYRARPACALDLRDVTDPERACRLWFRAAD
jgi:hypothetical protein